MSAPTSTNARAIAALCLAVASMAGGVASAGETRTTRAACGEGALVSGAASACVTRTGTWQVDLGDGVVRSSHGADFAPTNQHLIMQMDDVKKRDPKCVTTPRSQYHLKLIYAYSFDAPNNHTKVVPAVINLMRQINGFLYADSKRSGPPMQYRVACARSNRKIQIDAVRLDVSRQRTDVTGGMLDYMNIVNGVRSAGYTNPFAKYWIYYDGFSPVHPSHLGTASMAIDDRPTADNGNNFGPMYGVFYGHLNAYGAVAMMHEGSHILGAIQPSAPNSSGTFHCNDGEDVMCYPDGGPRSSAYNERRCLYLTFDCGKNDYFSTKPKPSSYLGTHWNLGSPINRFLQGCAYLTGQIQAGAGGPEADAALAPVAGDPWKDLATRMHAIPKSCRGRRFALTGAFSPTPSALDDALGRVPGTEPPTGFPVAGTVVGGGRPPEAFANLVAAPDVDVCFYAGSRRLSCASAAGTDLGTVPARATRARISLKAGALATYVLSVL